jgi:hypothetical protein
MVHVVQSLTDYMYAYAALILMRYFLFDNSVTIAQETHKVTKQ